MENKIMTASVAFLTIMHFMAAISVAFQGYIGWSIYYAIATVILAIITNIVRKEMK